MNAEIRDEWVRRLRSGDYAQGTGALCDEAERYCCLGVLCEVAVDVGVIPPRALSTVGGDYQYRGDALDVASSYPPRRVMDWAGFVTQGDEPGLGAYDLADLNDEGRTFTEIADVIEANF